MSTAHTGGMGHIWVWGLESLGPIKKIEGHYEGEPSYRFCCAHK